MDDRQGTPESGPTFNPIAHGLPPQEGAAPAREEASSLEVPDELNRAGTPVSAWKAAVSAASRSGPGRSSSRSMPMARRASSRLRFRPARVAGTRVEAGLQLRVAPKIDRGAEDGEIPGPAA